MGVMTAQWSVQFIFISAVWAVLGVFVIVLSCVHTRRYMMVLVLVGGCLLGMWRGHDVQQKMITYQRLVGRSITLQGKVGDDTETNRQGQTVLRLTEVQMHETILPGKIWVTVAKVDTIKRSDYVTIQGKMSEGFASFGAAMYRAELLAIERRAGDDVARDVRDSFSVGVQAGIHEPAVSLGLGFLTGQRRGLPPELLTTLQTAGLTHVIVASGYNLTILIRIARRIFDGVSRYLSVAVPGALILGFILITGMSPSMCRAGLVAGLSLLAWYYGRSFHPAVLLLLVAASTLLIDPTYGWGDIGWLLSFAAFAGVMILAPLLQAYFYGEKKPTLLVQVLFETTSAFIVTLPIIIVSFGVMSNVAILANLIVVPLIPFAMLGVFLVGVVGVFAGWAAVIIGAPVQRLLDAMIWLATFAANVSWAQTEVVMPIWGVGVYYVILISTGLLIWRRTRSSLQSCNIIT